MNELIDLYILDFLLGENSLTKEERTKKLEHLKSGVYDDFQVTMDFPAEVDETKFANVEEYLERLKTISKPFPLLPFY